MIRWVLTAQSGPHAGRDFLLISQEVRLGRVEGNDILISEPSLSRHHCSFFVEGDQLVVQDMNSKNGTWVNGKRSTRSELSERDTVRVGSTEFLVLKEEVNIATPARPIAQPELQDLPLLSEDLPTRVDEKPQGKLLLFAVCVVTPIVLFGISRSFVAQTTPQKEASKKRPQEESKKISDEVVPLSEQDFLDGKKVVELKSKADVALMMRDYPAAYQALKSLARLLPSDERVASQLKIVEKKIKKQIATHDENGVREYEKLNYDRAITEWRKVLVLSKDFDEGRYEDMLLRIKEAEAKLAYKPR